MSITDIDDDGWNEDLQAAARTLHTEWDSPELWPRIAERIAADQWEEEAGARTGGSTIRARWRFAAAAAVLLAAGLAFWLGARQWNPPPGPFPETATERALLSDPALAEIERAEAQYVGAIEQLARTVADRDARAPASPLLTSLRERLVVIDAAIAECRSEIEGNRFNAHLRRQLLLVYQEKRRTLEQILELEQNASS